MKLTGSEGEVDNIGDCGNKFFGFFERIEFCAFISRKLNKLRGPCFIFPDNFTHSILIAKNIPPGGQGSGATAPPNRSQRPKFQN